MSVVRGTLFDTDSVPPVKCSETVGLPQAAAATTFEAACTIAFQPESVTALATSTATYALGTSHVTHNV